MVGILEIRDEFFRRVLERDFNAIKQRQLEIANQRIYNQPNKRVTGDLRSFLSSGIIPADAETDDYGGVSIRLNYPIQIRFLDMKKNGNIKIYNRQIWGKVYNETLPELKHGLDEEIAEYIRGQLEGM